MKELPTLRVSYNKPPMWDEVDAKFDLTGKLPIFAYGDVVYNPFKININADLIVHEAVHMKQQGNTKLGAKLWWIRYLGDTAFMISQEAEAYNAQYKFACKTTKDRNKQFTFLHALALQLSGPMYGSPVSYQEAMRLIKTKI
jgi:hypothetical protein